MCLRLSVCLPLWCALAVSKADFGLGDIDVDKCRLMAVSAPAQAAIRHVTSAEATTWAELSNACNAQHTDYGLLQSDFAALSEADKALCQGQIVPLGLYKTPGDDRVYWWESDWPVNATDLQRMSGDTPTDVGFQVGVLNVSSGLWWLEEPASLRDLRCALCQDASNWWEAQETFHPEPPSYFRQARAAHRRVYGVTLTASLTLGPDDRETGVQLFLLQVYNVSHADVHVLNLTSQTTEMLAHVVSKGPGMTATGRVANGYQLTSVQPVDRCQQENTTDVLSGKPLTWRQTVIGTVDTIPLHDAHALSARRECYYDASSGVGRAAWSDVKYWDSDEERCLISQARPQLHNLTAWLRHAARHGHRLATAPLRRLLTQLNILTGFTDDEGRNGISKQFRLLPDLATVMSNIVFDRGDIFLADFWRLKTVAADATSHNPAMGFYLKSQLGPSSWLIKTISAIRRDDPLESSAEMRVFLSAELATSRVIFNLFSNEAFLFPVGASKSLKQVKDDLLLQCIVWPTLNLARDNETIYVDVYLQSGTPLFWDNDTEDWVRSMCTDRPPTMYYDRVYRCKLAKIDGYWGGLYYVSYYTEPPRSLSEFIGSSALFLVIIILSSFLCLFGLVSIALTAAFVNHWRKKLSNKILLNMSLSLTFNITIGFIINFVKTDTNRNLCFAIGVVRHYSYLAMFLWMLVLSFLQAKRLLTVLGAVATSSNLLLKSCLIAWGIPLIPVLTLAIWSRDFYKPNKKGFCCPEGLVFKLTVQGPAAFVLVSNAIIFLTILGRIFTCFGWGKIEDSHVHCLKEGSKVKRRVLTSVCIFVLFGFSWVVHWMAEDGVFNNEAVFEYLFLVTATSHIFALSIFFIFMDKTTICEWKNIFGKLRLGHGQGW